MPDRRLILALALVVLVGGCFATSVDQDAVAGDWRIVSVNGTAIRPRAAFLTLGDGRFKYDTGCNPVIGSAAIARGRLAVREYRGGMFCPEDDVEPAERRIFPVLTSGPSITLVEGRLVLGSAAGEIVLERVAP